MPHGNEQQSTVVDLSAYRSTRRVVDVAEREQREDQNDPAIEEIAHHLLMAVRVIKRIHQ